MGGTDVSKTVIANNIIECQGQSRPLLRNEASYGADIQNNRLTNVSDSERYKNPVTGAMPGLEEELSFKCGVDEELTVDGWKTRSTKESEKGGGGTSKDE